MFKTLLKAIGGVLAKIGLAATGERFMAKIAFDVLHWLASLTTNTLDNIRVQDLENIYYGKELHDAVDINNNTSRKT